MKSLTWPAFNRITLEGIETVRRLWWGEPYATPNGLGQPVPINIHPLPLQRDLNIWFTCSGGRERFVEAGRMGFNVLTALLFQGVDEIACLLDFGLPVKTILAGLEDLDAMRRRG